jgi:diaminopimelate decarboxylase
MSNNKDKILYKLAVRKIHVHKCPILLYDWERIRNNIIDCESIFRELNVKFLFPVKAFPYHKFLYNIAKMNMGFDVSQYSEYKLIKELITEETIVSFSSPSLCLDKIKKNIMGKHIIFYNSLNGINSKNKDKLFIRINITNIGLKFSHFGVDMINLNKENILGIHIHIPQDYKTNVFWKNIIQIIRTLKKDYVNLRYLNGSVK